MSESLVEKLNRMEKEIALLKSKPIPKLVNYKEGISLLEEANKNLTKVLSDLNKRYELLEQKFNSLNNKTPAKQIDYSEELTKINGEITSIKKNASNKKEINIKEEIEKVVNLPYVNGLYNRNK